jgi:hypothetical protein
MPTFHWIMDAVLGLPRHQRARRLRYLLRRSMRRTRWGSRRGRARVGGRRHYPHRRVPATPVVVPPPVPVAPPPPPPVAEAPRRILVQGVQYCAHHGWTAVVTMPGKPCDLPLEMESLPAPFVATPSPPTAPSPPPSTSQPTPSFRRSPTPAPPGFGRTGTMAARTGEPPLFTPSPTRRHAGAAAARRPGLRHTFIAVPHGSRSRTIPNGMGGNGIRVRPVSDSDEESGSSAKSRPACRRPMRGTRRRRIVDGGGGSKAAAQMEGVAAALSLKVETAVESAAVASATPPRRRRRRPPSGGIGSSPRRRQRHTSAASVVPHGGVDSGELAAVSDEMTAVGGGVCSEKGGGGGEIVGAVRVNPKTPPPDAPPHAPLLRAGWAGPPPPACWSSATRWWAESFRFRPTTQFTI